MELPYNEYVWFSPRFAIEYLWRLLDKHGDVVLKTSKYKKEREAWIMGVALLGVMKLTGAKWWLQVPKNDPPDMEVMTLVPDHVKQQNEMRHRLVEIMQITKYTNDTIVNEIMRKLRNKSYPPKTALVVYLNRKMFIEDMWKISAEFVDARPPVADIWIVASVKPDSQEYIFFSLYPTVQTVTYDIDEERRVSEPGDSIDVTPRRKETQLTLIRNARWTKFIPE